MNLGRRRLLRNFTTLGAGLVFAPAFAEVSPLESPAATPWERQWLVDGWLMVGTSTVAWAADAFDAQALARMSDRLQARGFSLVDCVAPTIDLLTMWHAGYPPTTNVLLDSGDSCVLIPGELSVASHRWDQLGLCYEEWVTRALVGTFATPFPQHVDFADVRWLVSAPGAPHRGNVCAIAAQEACSSVECAALDAFLDAEASLASRDRRTDVIYATYHGHDMMEGFRGISILQAHAPALVVGLDIDTKLTTPFVSVITATNS